jgi:predicted DNA-binding transcriptional regulator AlpA
MIHELEQYEYMTLEEVEKLTRMSERTIRRQRKLPKDQDPFPDPVELAPQVKVYPRLEVLAWVERRLVKRYQQRSA